MRRGSSTSVPLWPQISKRDAKILKLQEAVPALQHDVKTGLRRDQASNQEVRLREAVDAIEPVPLGPWLHAACLYAQAGRSG